MVPMMTFPPLFPPSLSLSQSLSHYQLSWKYCPLIPPSSLLLLLLPPPPTVGNSVTQGWGNSLFCMGQFLHICRQPFFSPRDSCTGSRRLMECHPRPRKKHLGRAATSCFLCRSFCKGSTRPPFPFLPSSHRPFFFLGGRRRRRTFVETADDDDDDNDAAYSCHQRRRRRRPTQRG